MKTVFYRKAAAGAAALVAGAVVGASGLTPAIAAPTDPVDFGDDKFKECVAAELGVEADSAITEDQMSTITGLFCSWDFPGITSLSGAEFLTNATAFSVADSEVTDLTPLSGLTNLESLTISSSPVEDLTPIQNLAKLTYLNLANSPNLDDADMEVVAKLTNLRALSIQVYGNQGNSKVTNLEFLSALNELRQLEAVGYPGITDLTPLVNLTNLQSVGVGGATENLSGVEDLTPLANLTNLSNLALYSTSVTGESLAPIANLTNLKALGLDNSKVDNLDSVAGLTGLTQLTFSNNLVSDGIPQSGQNAVTDLTPLESLTNLNVLQFIGNGVTDLTPIADLPLEYLAASSQYVNSDPRFVGKAPFNVVAPDGSNVAPSTITPDTATFDATDNTINYTADGSYRVEWSQPVTIGSADSTFSGLLTQDISGSFAAPVITKAVSDEPGDVTLEWNGVTDTNDNGEVVGYNIRFREVGTTTWGTGTINGTAPEVTWFKSGGLTKGATYEFQVAARTDTGAVSAYSASQVLEVKDFPPSLTNVNAEVVDGENGKDVVLTWDAVTDTNNNGDVAEYIVTYAPVGQLDSGVSTEVRTEDNTVRISNLAQNGSYDFRVDYVTTTGYTPEDATELTVSLSDEIPAVANVAVENITSTSATVKWDAVTDTNGNGEVQNYVVVYGNLNGGGGDAITVPADTTSLNLELQPNREYSVAIYYTTNTGVSSQGSEVVDFKTDVMEAPALSGLTATADAATAGQVNLEWTALAQTPYMTGGNGDVTTYSVFWRAAGATEWTLLVTEAGDETVNGAVAMNFAAGTYEFAVRYNTETVESPLSNVASVTIANGVAGGAGTDPVNTGEENNGAETAGEETAAENSEVSSTGGDYTTLAVAGGALLILGAGAVIYSRRRAATQN